MDARVIAAASLAAATVAAGCVVPAPAAVLETEGDGAPTPRPRWAPDDWWAFHVEDAQGGSADVAYVVHEADRRGYRLGSNRSNGFFGVPFDGRLNRDLDPRVAGERWDMFRFPLRDGEAWTQTFLGHVVTTRVQGAQLETPEGAVDGFRLRAQAYGVEVATYTYAPEVGWLTSFTLRDPQSGEALAWANLTDRGRDYRGTYLVREPVESVGRSYPSDLPGETTFEVDGDGLRVSATLVASAGSGQVKARLEDPDGQVVTRVEATGQEVDDAQATWDVDEGRWTLHHRGLGSGRLHLQVHLVRLVGRGPAPAGGPASEDAGGGLQVDLADLRAG